MRILRWGDADAEDAWDAGDPDEEKAVILRRWVDQLEDEFELEGLTDRVAYRLADLDVSASAVRLPHNSHLLERIAGLRLRIEGKVRPWAPGS